jgi:hypothetical protein
MNGLPARPPDDDATAASPPAVLSVHSENGGIVIEVVGGFTDRDAIVLRQATEAALTTASHVLVDLCGVLSFSNAGVRELAGLSDLGPGVRFRVGAPRS